MPPRRILVVVTVGGSTNSAPIFEICKTLHARGHTIDFATLAGREHLAYPCVSSTYTVGRAITLEEEEDLYIRFGKWKFSGGQSVFIGAKKFYDSFWTETYFSLKDVIEKAEPDFIFADYQVDAARDMSYEYGIPLATMWPQFPWVMCPQSYIPGQPGMQQRCLTSEHASIWDRIVEELYPVQSAKSFLGLIFWTRKMRLNAGVERMLPILKKPDYLLFVNSFVGLEVPKDLPPLVEAVGPILSDQYTPLAAYPDIDNFLGSHRKVTYIAFGTHVILAAEQFQKLAQGLAIALRQKTIDGVVWAMHPMARRRLEHELKVVLNGEVSEYSSIFENNDAQWKIVDFAPQRAILDYPSTRLFLTHAGPSSANEAIYHGVPMLAMGIYGDQLPNSMRLKAAGVAETIEKDTFTAKEVSEKISLISRDVDAHYLRDVIRMQRIARIASRRKELAADRIEEVLYDHELRFERSKHDYEWRDQDHFPSSILDRGKERRPMHLQTADMRMSWIKAHNVDIWLALVGLSVAVAGAIGLGARLI